MENQLKEDEIDLIALIKSLWISKKLIIKLTAAFAALGVVVALHSPIEYTASSTFIPQSSQAGSSSNLSGVASLVGISLGGNISGNEIPPSLYPQIIQSTTYKRDLLKLPLKISSEKPSVLLKDYMLQKNSSSDFLGIVKKYTIMLPFTILSAIKGEEKNSNYNSSNSAMSVSSEEEELFKNLTGILKLSVNSKERFVTLSASMENPLVSAIIAKGAQEILQKNIINYKIKSASEQLEFNQKQLDLKKIEFDSLQNKLALFKDSNLNIVDSRFQNKLSGLESEFNIVSAVYQELSKQLEQSKLQVSRDTPVFSIINRVTIPNQRSAPKRSLTVVIYSFIGFILGCGFVLIKTPFLQVIKEIKS
ncbi:Wzz/FepE/Etk N-terminal domain-containing protein [Flavobacteriaceae bacterium]|nr:Wzz/FepE/Etk N-terminal domain-containing protein [Flavobacteriaceae bacterium]